MVRGFWGTGFDGFDSFDIFGIVTPDNFFKDICDFLDSYHKAIDELEDEKIKAEKARKREEEEEKKAKKKEEMQKAKEAKV